jgi:hypothetical protein
MEHRGTGVVYLLNRIMWECAQHMAVDRLLMAVHPNAMDLYAATMLFEQVGPVRHYPGLNTNALAVAMMQDVTTSRRRFVRDFGHMPNVFGNSNYLYNEMPAPQIALDETVACSEAHSRRAELGATLVRARWDLFRSLPRECLAHLRVALPDVYWPSNRALIEASYRLGWARTSRHSVVRTERYVDMTWRPAAALLTQSTFALCASRRCWWRRRDECGRHCGSIPEHENGCL